MTTQTYIIEGSTLTNIADAIRGKTGGTDQLTPTQMATEIESLEVGGGNTDIEDGLVNGSITEYSNPRVTSIRGYAFYSCTSLTTINLPLVTTIAQYALSKCTALTALILRNEAKICTLQKASTLQSTPIASGTGYIYVPDALVDKYKAATNWSTYADQIKPLSELEEDGV